MRLGLTKRQSEVLHFIREFIQRHGFPPTLHEIREHFGFASTNAVSQQLDALERKGYISRRRKHCARSIQLIDDSTPAASSSPPTAKTITIIGTGTADNPLSVFLSPAGQVTIDTTLFSSSLPLFAAYVPDAALQPEGIIAGDLVIAEKTDIFSTNSLVIGLLHHHLFIRRYTVASDGQIELRAAAKGFPPIKCSTTDPHIALLGKVIGIIRHLP